MLQCVEKDYLPITSTLQWGAKKDKGKKQLTTAIDLCHALHTGNNLVTGIVAGVHVRSNYSSQFV